ncbi:MAG: cysteine--tRNA ligase [Liquorilactobacillus ghanensis]
MLQMYNTLTKRKEKFKPQVPGVIKMYVCGPTVYNYIHIGNARSAVAFDTIRRYFEFRGFQVDYVSNFTDVDDKIIRASKEQHLTPQQLADKYIAAFYQDTDALNIKRATLNPRVTETMPDIIDFIQVLLDKGYAYQAAGDVYYRARRFKNYGQLSGQSVDELELGASERLDAADEAKKEDPLDFALWKAAKPDEIFWTAPWGKGRPGWHIECSVMATKFLGETIDIHAGGQDLEFPHHENEIAQSEAKTGKKFANYWLHNGFVTIGEDDAKMSKSLGNFVTVHDLLKENDPQVLRFFMATTQYRRPIRYSQANLKEAAANLLKLKTAFRNATYRLKTATDQPVSAACRQLITQQKEKFIAAMDDDFNVQNAVMAIYELTKQLNIYVTAAEVGQQDLLQLQQALVELCAVLGINLTAAQTKTDLTEQIEQLITQRNQARKAHDFAKSDAIRDQLKAQGVLLEDTPQGTRWKFTNE